MGVAAREIVDQFCFASSLGLATKGSLFMGCSLEKLFRFARRSAIRKVRQSRFLSRRQADAGKRVRQSQRGQLVETLEPRLAFDAVAFEGTDTVTVVVSNGDPLYLSELSTVPTSIAYTTEADWLGDENNTDRILNSDRFNNIMITEGRSLTEDVVLADQYPSQ